jgi:potassium/chloride transporter 9
LLFVKNPKTDYKLIKYCSKLKKGGLYIIGNIKIGDNLSTYLDVIEKDKDSLEKLIKKDKLKAFSQIILSNTIKEGISNLIMSSGLGIY